MKANIKKRLLTTASAALLCVSLWAQTTITGRVVDPDGNPIVGAVVTVDGTTTGTITDNNGNYSISAPVGAKINYSYGSYKPENRGVEDGQTTYDVTLGLTSGAAAEEYTNDFTEQIIRVGAVKDFDRAHSTGAASVITTKDVDRRTAKNIGNSILGEGNGLISLDGTGTYFQKNPTFYVRGLQSLNENAPLCLVDGIERNITVVSPQEVESVTILKDAAAVALYGYKGANGVVLIQTKRGHNDDSKIGVMYERSFNMLTEKPEFIEAADYARARNEALALEGQKAQYSDNDIAAYESGQYAEYFPNVDWVGETFRDKGYTNRYTLDFTGGGQKFKYYTMLALLSDKGFVKHHDANDGYDTQDMYSRGNLRTNLDIDVTEYTKLHVNVAGVLSEMRKPGAGGTNLWELVYKIPNLAYPVENSKGWGGNATWDVNSASNNPVAHSMGAGYYKIHERALYADIALEQDLSMFVEGLGVFGRMGYDNYSTLYEDHSKAFTYGSFATKWNADGTLKVGDYSELGKEGELGSGANTDSWERRGTIIGGFTFDKQLNDDNYLYAQLKYDYEYEDKTGNNTIVHRQDFSWWSHYALQNKYMLDLALVASESSRLAPNYKWNFAPTVSLGWVVTNEDFLAGNDAINFLKVRASYGKINTDWLPDGSWTYYTQSYSTNGVTYPFLSDYAGDGGETLLGRMATEDPTVEKAYKLNVGIDATLFKGLNLEFDYFSQKNKDAWVDGSGAYSRVIGFTAPFANIGETKMHGIDVALDYTKNIGDLTFNLGGNLTFSKSEIVEMGEEPRAFQNLVRTGDPLQSTYGLRAIGFFNSQEEIDNSPAQSFTTTRPGDIKYEDVNGDGKVDNNDQVRLDYSRNCPELYYSFHLGAEFKGIGLNAMFQGVGNYSGYYSINGYNAGLINNTPLAKEVYESHWTPTSHDAKYPRLSSSSNANNYQVSTFWLKDRSYLKLRNVELYYNFSEDLLEPTFINGAKIFVRGVDLFTIDKIDGADAAVYGANQPPTRSVIVGCSLSF